MKNVLIGLLVLGSLSAFAGAKRLSNKELTSTVKNLEQRIMKIEKKLNISCILSNTENSYKALFIDRTAPVLEGRFFGNNERGYEQAGVTISVVKSEGLFEVHKVIEVDGRVVEGSKNLSNKAFIKEFCEIVNKRI